MDVKELLESYSKVLEQISEVRRNLALYRSYQEGDEKERVYWTEQAACKEAEEEKLVHEAEIKRKRIRLALQKLPETTQREVLSMRYLDRMTFLQISRQEQFTLRHIYRIHRGALELLQKQEVEIPETGEAATA